MFHYWLYRMSNLKLNIMITYSLIGIVIITIIVIVIRKIRKVNKGITSVTNTCKMLNK